MSANLQPAKPVPTTENCRFCWMCRHVCPVGHVTHRETHTPHAWALTIDAVKRGTLKWDRESVDVLYACADCGLCRTHCVTDQPLPNAIAAARAEVAEAGKAPKVVYEIEARMKAQAKRPASKGEAVAPARGETGLYLGDVGEARHAASLSSARALLKAAGVTVVPVAAGAPSGLLASSLGLRSTAIGQARAVVAAIEAAGCREVLVVSPGDRFAFEHVYRERLGVTWPAAVTIREVTTVLAEAYAAGRLRLRPRDESETAAITWAYHDPCHAPRIDRDGAPARTLIAAVLGEAGSRQLFWREGRAHPCGALGGLEHTQPAIAESLADARLADARQAGAEWLITDDPGCLQHLDRRARDQSQPLKVQSVFDLLARQIL